MYEYILGTTNYSTLLAYGLFNITYVCFNSDNKIYNLKYAKRKIWSNVMSMGIWLYTFYWYIYDYVCMHANVPLQSKSIELKKVNK